MKRKSIKKEGAAITLILIVCAGRRGICRPRRRSCPAGTRASSIAPGMFPRGEDIEVLLSGGMLTINEEKTIRMTGEAKTVFTGEVEL